MINIQFLVEEINEYKDQLIINNTHNLNRFSAENGSLNIFLLRVKQNESGASLKFSR